MPDWLPYVLFAIAGLNYLRIRYGLFRNRSIEPGSEAEWLTLSAEEQKRRIRALEIECGLTPSEPLQGPEKGDSVTLRANGVYMSNWGKRDPEVAGAGSIEGIGTYITAGAIRTEHIHVDAHGLIVAGDNAHIGPLTIDYTNGHACNDCEFIDTVDGYGNVRRHVGSLCERHTEELVEEHSEQMRRVLGVPPMSLDPGETDRLH